MIGAIVLLVIIFSNPASAQVYDEELRAAMSKCNDHVKGNGFEPGWEKCAVIVAEFNRRFPVTAPKPNVDRDFIDRIHRGLSK